MRIAAARDICIITVEKEVCAMAHDYYQYNKEQLLANPNMPLICMADNSQVFEAMAKQMVEEIEDHNAKGEKTVFICPVGPVGQYPYFVDMVN